MRGDIASWVGEARDAATAVAIRHRDPSRAVAAALAVLDGHLPGLGDLAHVTVSRPAVAGSIGHVRVSIMGDAFETFEVEEVRRG